MRLTRILTIATWLIGSAATAMAQDVDLPAGRIVGEGQMQVGRYTTIVAAPAEAAARPLDVYVQLSYPRQTVHTVGDALRHTLMRTGWSLVDPSAMSPQAARLLSLPLPESQRVIGPYRARTVLEVLTGPSWQWHEDDVQRKVWFTLKASEVAAVDVQSVQEQAVATAVTETSVSAQPLPQHDGGQPADGSQ